jgi:hypothetical protein
VAYLRRRVALPSQEAWDRLAGDPYLASWLNGGQVFDHRPAGQHAAAVQDPADALLRVSIEPGAPGTPVREVVFWLSAWGPHEPRVRQVEALWAGRLAALFPEGHAP